MSAASPSAATSARMAATASRTSARSSRRASTRPRKAPSKPGAVASSRLGIGLQPARHRGGEVVAGRDAARDRLAEVVEPAGDAVGAELDLGVALEDQVDVDQPVAARLGRDGEQRQLAVEVVEPEALVLDLLDALEYERRGALGQAVAARGVFLLLAPVAGEGRHEAALARREDHLAQRNA